MKPGPTLTELLEAQKSIPVPDEEVVRAYLTRVPPSWTLILKELDGAAFTRGNIQVIAAVAIYDGQTWIHVSACGRRGPTSYYLPSWDDMKRVKHDFFGPDKWAYTVFPCEAEYVNQHPYVLHIFGLLEGTPALPDFTRGLRSL